MKRDSIYLLLGVLLAYTVAFMIDWGNEHLSYGTILRGHPATNIVEFGLRSDGVVVWRQMTQQPGWVTNSPAEAEPPGRVWLYNGGTNVWLTNLDLTVPRYDLTNLIFNLNHRDGN